jgi:hypothetical protein
MPVRGIPRGHTPLKHLRWGEGVAGLEKLAGSLPHDGEFWQLSKVLDRAHTQHGTTANGFPAAEQHIAKSNVKVEEEHLETLGCHFPGSKKPPSQSIQPPLE